MRAKPNTKMSLKFLLCVRWRWHCPRFSSRPHYLSSCRRPPPSFPTPTTSKPSTDYEYHRHSSWFYTTLHCPWHSHTVRHCSQSFEWTLYCRRPPSLPCQRRSISLCWATPWANCTTKTTTPAIKVEVAWLRASAITIRIATVDATQSVAEILGWRFRCWGWWGYPHTCDKRPQKRVTHDIQPRISVYLTGPFLKRRRAGLYLAGIRREERTSAGGGTDGDFGGNHHDYWWLPKDLLLIAIISVALFRRISYPPDWFR